MRPYRLSVSILILYILWGVLHFYVLGDFLVSNYKQALDILNRKDALKKMMIDQGIQGLEVFDQWLEEERAYLYALSKEPAHETLEMDYYAALVVLQVNEYIVLLPHLQWISDDKLGKNMLQYAIHGTIIPWKNHHQIQSCPPLA